MIFPADSLKLPVYRGIGAAMFELSGQVAVITGPGSAEGIGFATSSAREIKAGRATLIGRLGTPSEVAACAAFLALPEAAYDNGAMLVVDGGKALQEMKIA